MRKHWTILLAIWLLLASAFYFASSKSAREKSTRDISAAINPGASGPANEFSRPRLANGPNQFTKVSHRVNIPHNLLTPDTIQLTSDQKAALTATAFALAQSNPAAAVEFAAKYRLDNGSGDVLPNLAQQWAQTNFDSALQWAVAQPAGDQRDQVLTRVAYIESQTAPRDAANLVINEITPGPAQQEAALMVLHQWMLQDFAAAKAWAAQFPEGPFKQRVAAELAGGAQYLSVSQPTR